MKKTCSIGAVLALALCAGLAPAQIAAVVDAPGAQIEAIPAVDLFMDAPGVQPAADMPAAVAAGPASSSASKRKGNGGRGPRG